MNVGKLRGPVKVRAAAAHNLREIPVGSDEHIDLARTRLNYALAGPSSAEDVWQQALQRMTEAGIDTTRLRKNCVHALEVLFSLPVGSPVADRSYFEACVVWAGQQFGGAENIISAVVHMDEAARHCHVILVPALEGRMRGSDMVGFKDTLAKHQGSFHAAVASRFGFVRPVKMSAGQKRATTKAVLQHLREVADPALKSALWATFRSAIEAAPGAFAEALGVGELPAERRKQRTLTDIFISRGKGPKVEPGLANPIGLTGSRDKPYRDSERTLSCVGNVSDAAALTDADAVLATAPLVATRTAA